MSDMSTELKRAKSQGCFGKDPMATEEACATCPARFECAAGVLYEQALDFEVAGFIAARLRELQELHATERRLHKQTQDAAAQMAVDLCTEIATLRAAAAGSTGSEEEPTTAAVTEAQARRRT